MNLEELSETDSTIIGQCLRAAVDGPFFPEWEFIALFGIHREEVRKIANEWPRNSSPTRDVVVAISNSINNLLYYPHRQHNLWTNWISADQKKAKEILERIHGKPIKTYFDGVM